MDATKDFHEALDVIYEFGVKGRGGSIESTKKLDQARSVLVTLFGDVVREYNGRKSQVASLEQSLEDARMQLNSARRQRDEMEFERKRLDRVRSERDDLRELVEIKVQEIQELRRPIDEHTKPLHAEIESLKIGLEEMGKRANSEYAARLSADLATKKANEQAAGLVTRIADQRTEIAKLQAALDTCEVHLRVERNRADTERLKHSNASAAADSLQQLVLRLKSEIETQRGAKERNAAELAEVRRELENVKRDASKQVQHYREQAPARGTAWVLLKGREDAVTFEADERCLGTYVEALRTNQPFTYVEGGGVQHFIPVASIETLSFKAESAS